MPVPLFVFHGGCTVDLPDNRPHCRDLRQHPSMAAPFAIHFDCVVLAVSSCENRPLTDALPLTRI